MSTGSPSVLLSPMPLLLISHRLLISKPAETHARYASPPPNCSPDRYRANKFSPSPIKLPRPSPTTPSEDDRGRVISDSADVGPASEKSGSEPRRARMPLLLLVANLSLVGVKLPSSCPPLSFSSSGAVRERDKIRPESGWSEGVSLPSAEGGCDTTEAEGRG